MTNPRELINFLSENDITLEEYFILYLFATKDYASYYKYGNEVLKNKNRYISKENVLDLENRGFLKKISEERWQNYLRYIKTEKGDPSKIQPILDLFDITESFRNIFIVATDIAIDEIFKEYPKYMRIEGKAYSCFTISKEEFKKKYYQRYGSDIYAIVNKNVKSFKITQRLIDSGIIFARHHQRNLEAIQLYKKMLDQGSIGEVGLDKFFESRLNENIFEIYDNDNDSYINTMIDE